MKILFITIISIIVGCGSTLTNCVDGKNQTMVFCQNGGFVNVGSIMCYSPTNNNIDNGTESNSYSDGEICDLNDTNCNNTALLNNCAINVNIQSPIYTCEDSDSQYTTITSHNSAIIIYTNLHNPFAGLSTTCTLQGDDVIDLDACGRLAVNSVCHACEVGVDPMLDGCVGARE